MAASGFSRRDLLKVGGGVVVGLALGYGLSRLTKLAALRSAWSKSRWSPSPRVLKKELAEILDY